MGRAPRAEQFQASEICVVHVTQRCVRRAFLAGVDPRTGTDHSARREWIRRRLEALASVFGVDTLTYAVMSNHVHLIVRNRPDVVATWSDREVAIRWLRVFPGRRLEEHLAEPTESDVEMLVADPQRLTEIRGRLSDISWFMRALSEPIARMANRQDECTGHFWEGRFKAQRIVDEAGLLACAMYVDLNPVRAAMATQPEQAEHTSAQDRARGQQGQLIDSAAFDLVPVSSEAAGEAIRDTPIEQLKRQRRAKRRNPTGRRVRRDAWLAPLPLDEQVLSADPQVHTDGLRASDKGFLSLSWGDYLELLRWTAAQTAAVLGTKLPDHLAQLLTSRGIDASLWCDLIWNFKKYFGRGSCVGGPASMSEDAQRSGHRWHWGQKAARNFFVAA